MKNPKLITIFILVRLFNKLRLNLQQKDEIINNLNFIIDGRNSIKIERELVKTNASLMGTIERLKK